MPYISAILKSVKYISLPKLGPWKAPGRHLEWLPNLNREVSCQESSSWSTTGRLSPVRRVSNTDFCFDKVQVAHFSIWGLWNNGQWRILFRMATLDRALYSQHHWAFRTSNSGSSCVRRKAPSSGRTRIGCFRLSQ